MSILPNDLLEKALVETNILNNLEVFQFEAMVGHLIALHCLSFSEYDDISLSHPYIATFHIKVQIHKHHVKRVLIDGEAKLNICTLKLIQALGFSKHAIEFKIQYIESKNQSTSTRCQPPIYLSYQTSISPNPPSIYPHYQESIHSMNPQQTSIAHPHPKFDKGNQASTSYSSPSYSNPFQASTSYPNQPSTSTYQFTTSQSTIPSNKNTLINDVQG